MLCCVVLYRWFSIGYPCTHVNNAENEKKFQHRGEKQKINKEINQCCFVNYNNTKSALMNEQIADLDFFRQDIHQIGSLSKKTLRVLPVGQNKLQKVAAGDDLGYLQIFTLRKGDILVTTND